MCPEFDVNGNAALLRTGERNLFVLHPFRDIKIVTPAIYLGL